jgi:hypothetical protein
MHTRYVNMYRAYLLDQHSQRSIDQLCTLLHYDSKFKKHSVDLCKKLLKAWFTYINDNTQNSLSC